MMRILEEGKISFPPTYKFIENLNRYDSKFVHKYETYVLLKTIPFRLLMMFYFLFYCVAECLVGRIEYFTKIW